MLYACMTKCGTNVKFMARKNKCVTPTVGSSTCSDNNILLCPGGAASPQYMFGPQAGVGLVQRICADNQELHSNMYRH